MTSQLTAVSVHRASIPIIDISGLSSSSPKEYEAVGTALRSACLDKGFFYISHHGVPDELIRRVFDQARAFFAQTEADKKAINAGRTGPNRGYEPVGTQVLEKGMPADLKESFLIGRELSADDPRVIAKRFDHGPNFWPQGLADFRSAMQAYYEAMLKLSWRVMEGLALSLRLPKDYFASFNQDPIATLRLLHYPPQPAVAAYGEKGCGAHTDFSAITLLLQDDCGGLQIWDEANSQWIYAEPVSGTYIVNLGDMMARWTNDMYRSTVHRVVNFSGRERYSIPFFYSGHADYPIEPIPTCMVNGGIQKYRKTTVEAHLRERILATRG